ncbi:unnamed protein product [Miscanthus lutarioriparius]|uniref:Fucosyltransferase n=1 Tax=Miscanthus lutarioriparius TaxID=422564 RepID=A0A811SJV0_9POAL|nr:unnamed protein product [Miscanthus lutarioriparius]
MQQRKAKVVWGGVESAAAQEIPAMAMARNGSWPEAEGAPEHSPVPRKKRLALDEKRWNTVVNVMLIAFVMAVPPVIVVYAWGGIAPTVWIAAAKAQLRRGSGDGSFPYARSPPDKLLGGLLPDGLDERSCRSRYESSMYNRKPARRPSPHLIAKLRRHEELQRRCGPNTDAYSRAVQQLRAGKSVDSPECKYVVSISHRGLGNRILAAASAFLYAHRHRRELRQHAEEQGAQRRRADDGDAAAGVRIPPPRPRLRRRGQDVLLRRRPAAAVERAVAGHEDRHVHRDGAVPGHGVPGGARHAVPGARRRVPPPGAVPVPPTQPRLGPRHAVLPRVLARAELRLGVQLRHFDSWAQQSPIVLRQITSCLWREKLLPEVLDTEEHSMPMPGGGARTTAVLVTSLQSWYYERIKGMYWDHATATGEDVSVHQPSHEGNQEYGKKSHDERAWAEMYLLSLCDVLVTSGWSTFGYVAQGLGGMTPWVLHKPTNVTSPPDPPCFWDMSMEPCFHAPHAYDCKLKRGADTGKMVPHVRNCEDVSWGLKLVDTKLYKA